MARETALPTRRSILGGGAALIAGGLIAPPTQARGTKPADRTDLLFDQTGNFDLSNPQELLLARAKAVSCLSGERVHIAMMTRHMLAPPGKVPFQILAEVELMTIWLAPDLENQPNKAAIQALFTRIPVDPLSFQPVTKYHNAYLGRDVDVEHTIFGGSGLPLDPADPVPNIIFQQDEPHYRMGREIGFVMFDPRSGEGAHQPHVDTAVFRVDHDALMDPATASVAADYSYTSFLRASIFPWTGIEKGDETQVLTLKEGRKIIGGVQALPAEFQNTIGQLYPERI
ncbi:MAG: hypothetical protein AAGE37_00925 [Pseudomonadota bacterium]